MKAKKMTLMVVVALSIMIFFATNAISAYDWYYCDVVTVGPAGSTYYIKLVDTAGAFPQTWFTLPDAYKKEYLAIALTAMSSAMTVRVRIDAAVKYSDVAAMYLQQQ